MFDAVSIALDGTDLTPDVAELLSKINDVQLAERTVTLTTRDLGTIAQALGGMQRALQRAIRTAPDDAAADSVTELFTETTLLSRRMQAEVTSSFTEALGADFDSSEAARKLQGLMGNAIQQQQASEPADDRVGQYL
jgi:cysteinyl-tRNA synthetase